MREFGSLLYNEMEKLYYRKRIWVILGLLVVLIPLFVYGQSRQSQQIIDKLGTDDWRIQLQQEIADTQNRLNSTGIPEEFRSFLQVQVQQEQYYLDNNINPNTPGAPTFVREFIAQSTPLFLPLLIMVIAIDIVSAERTEGTIKLLLTRPIRRWKILMAKYVTMLLSVGLILLFMLVTSYLISGVAFGYKGWDMPVLTGFVVENNSLDTSAVALMPQWKYILMVCGFAGFVGVVTGTISFMLSVLVRNAPAAMGIMLAFLIAGGILQGFARAWDGAKYLFSVNLGLTDFLSGSIPAVEGLTLSFSIWNLLAWGSVALFISFWRFTRQDMAG
ncbi:MAG: ABC transporter permease subunit [Bacilli bacterium]